MKYGFVLPRGDARTAAGFAREAEAAGWDGFFVWEPVWGIDAWVCLAAAAMQTERVRLGTMITPLSRMRPWKLAGETATVDRLSNGRVMKTACWKPRRLRRGGKRAGSPSPGRGNIEKGWGAVKRCYTGVHESEAHRSYCLPVGLSLCLDPEVSRPNAGWRGG